MASSRVLNSPRPASGAAPLLTGLPRKRLHRVHRGVYLVGHRAPSPMAREMAALLACGDGAVLSHHAAGWLWELRPRFPGPVDVTVAGRDPGPRPGVCVHRVGRLAEPDIRRHKGFPLTAPARSLLDLAEVLGRRELERAINESEVRRLVARKELWDVI